MSATKKLIPLAKKTVTTAGTRVQITTSDIRSSSILIQADSANSGRIYVGDSTVASTLGVALTAGQSLTIDADNIRGTTEEFKLSDIWLDSSANGDSAHIFYLGRG